MMPPIAKKSVRQGRLPLREAGGMQLRLPSSGHVKRDQPPPSDPYWVSPHERAPRARAARAAPPGAWLVLFGSIASSLVRAGFWLAPLWAMRAALRATGRSPMVTISTEIARSVDAALIVLAGALVIGSRRLTERGRDDGISDALRAATRLFALGYAVAVALGVVASLRADAIGFDFFDTAGDVARHVAEALLAFVAAHHLVRNLPGFRGRAFARGARMLGWATLLAVVAQWWLTRPTHDDMFFTVMPTHADLVMPMNVILWLGKVVAFGGLALSNAQRADGS